MDDLFDKDVNDELDRKGIGEVALLLGLTSRYAHDGEKFRDTYRLIESKLSTPNGCSPITCFNVSPSTYCITMKCLPADSPTS